MAAPYIIPFNFQPVNTVSGSGSYTVPAGKYAKVDIYLSSGMGLNAPTVNSGTITSAAFTAIGAQGKDTVMSLYLKAGDVVSFSTSGPTSQTVNTGSINEVIYLNAAATQLALLNGVTFLEARTVYSGLGAYAKSAAGAILTQSYSASYSNRYVAQEYNFIS